MSDLNIQISRIIPGRNPRTYFDPHEMNELKASIQRLGVLQPILVRPVTGQDYFELIAGERRWRAVKEIFGENAEIPAMIQNMTDQEADEAAATENIQRANMSLTEEARAASRIVGNHDGDREIAAKQLGWSRSKLESRLALMSCTDAVQKALDERRILLGHAELLATVSKPTQDKVLEKILTAPVLISIAQLKGDLQASSLAMASAIFNKTDCAACPHNSDNQQALFAEKVESGFCTNSPCYKAKTEAELEQRKAALVDHYPTVRIVRAGDNSTVIKLNAQGDNSVGEAQAQACKGCKDYGAAISAIPDKLGRVYEGMCFNLGCHTLKVAAAIQANQPATLSKSNQPNAQGKVKSNSEPTAPKVNEAQKVKDYRIQAWRKAIKRELLNRPKDNLLVLFGLGVAGLLRHVDGTGLAKAIEKLTSQKTGSDLKSACTVLGDLEPSAIEQLQLGIAASAINQIEANHLNTLRKFLEIDLRKYWQINEEFLTLLTKSEIEVIASELGMKDALGKEASKLFSGKKEELIKSLLNIAGFEYAGKLPKVLELPC